MRFSQVGQAHIVNPRITWEGEYKPRIECLLSLDSSQLPMLYYYRLGVRRE